MELIINENTCLKDFIRIEKNVLSDELCDEIVNEYKNDLFTRSPVMDKREIFSNWRNCESIQTSSTENLEVNIRRKELDHIIYEKVTEYGISYLKSVKAEGEFSNDSGYELLKYEVGQHYKEHVDECGTVRKENGEIEEASLIKRKLTFIIQLNDDFEGGGLSFWENTYKIEIEKGSAILFPPYYLFPHQALPVTKGTRYSLITWLF